MPSAIRTTFVICCVPLDLLSRPLSFFIHMTNARKDYIGNAFNRGSNPRLFRKFEQANIFTQFVVMAWAKASWILTNALEITLVDAPRERSPVEGGEGSNPSIRNDVAKKEASLTNLSSFKTHWRMPVELHCTPRSRVRIPSGASPIYRNAPVAQRVEHGENVSLPLVADMFVIVF